MHVTEVEIEEPSILMEDDAGVDVADVAEEKEADVPESHVEGGSLADEGEEKASDGKAGGPEEYEYVNLSEATSGWIASAKEFVAEHIVPVICAVVVLLCILIMGVGRRLNGVLIAIGFVVIVFIFGIALYFAWQERKETQQKYEYAKKLQELTRDKVMDEYDD